MESVENLVVDNEHLNLLADGLEGLVGNINKIIDRLRDDNADMFSKYMAFQRGKSLITCTNMLVEISHYSMVAGHALNHPIFHTAEGKKKGWSKVEVSGNPFFINPKPEENPLDKLFEDLKGLLKNEI